MKKSSVVRIFPWGDDARAAIAILCVVLIAPQNPSLFAQAPPASSTNNQEQTSLPPGQLDSLVAPIALYPDSLLSQVLVASTYPLEIVEADRWLKQNSSLKGKALTDAASKQTWDPSVQALVVFPDVLTQLNGNIGWTTDLGNAFLAQESGVMDAVQRLRQKAQQSGKLNSTPQQTVTSASENNTTYVEIQPANPEVIYVPQYDPVAVWGPPPAYYPYPAVVYPSTGAIATGVLSFGAGIAVGALISGGSGWGWGCGWGSRSVTVNNNFIRSNHFNNVNMANGNRWVHNPVHRAGVPYNNRALSNRYDAGAARVGTRPTVGQTQQRLGEAQRQVGPAENRAGRPGSGQGIGSASRSTIGGGNAMGGQRTGSANRAMPGGGSPRTGMSPMGGGHGAGGMGQRGGGGGGGRGGGGRGGGRRR